MIRRIESASSRSTLLNTESRLIRTILSGFDGVSLIQIVFSSIYLYNKPKKTDPISELGVKVAAHLRYCLTDKSPLIPNIDRSPTSRSSPKAFLTHNLTLNSRITVSKALGNTQLSGNSPQRLFPDGLYVPCLESTDFPCLFKESLK